MILRIIRKFTKQMKSRNVKKRIERSKEKLSNASFGEISISLPQGCDEDFAEANKLFKKYTQSLQRRNLHIIVLIRYYRTLPDTKLQVVDFKEIVENNKKLLKGLDADETDNNSRPR